MKALPVGPIILDVQGHTLNEEEQEILRHPLVGGVIFFSRNFESRAQLADLAKHIKSIRPNCLLCVDQEGGRVQRFIAEMTRLPKMRILGDWLDSKALNIKEVAEVSENLGLLMALEVRSLGVDLSFAPVLDLDFGLSEVMRDRAIHSSPEIVATLGTAYIKGMAQAGMRATGKHFPGHGSVALDSHLTLPENLKTLAEIQSEIIPFERLIGQGLAAIMPAHIVYPNIDKYPVGFSSYWLQTVLRQQLQFKGAIISDCLSMEGAAIMGDYAQRAQSALDAGCDYTLICNNRAGAITALERITDKNLQDAQVARLSLFAQGNSPTWTQLNQSAAWQSAHTAVERLQQIPV